MPFLAPLGVALGAAFTGLSTWLAGGTLLAGLAQSGLAMAAQFLIGKLFAPKPQAQSVQLEVTYGDKMPRTVVLGPAASAGHHVFRNAFGKGNRTVQDVFIASHFRVADIPRYRAEGQWRILQASATSAGQRIDDIDGTVRVLKHLGDLDQTADAWLVANGGDRWSENHRGAGISYIVATTTLNREKLTSPWEPFFEIEGPLLYDWRADSSVGGDGDDRWDDPDTWSGRFDNPVLQMYLLERGVFHGTELIVGKGAPASRLPLAEWTIAANICDEEDSNSLPKYRSGIVAAAGEGVTHDSNMQPLLNACAASWVDDASGEYPIVGAVQAVVATFTDDDLMPGQPYRFSRFRPKSELVNTVTGTYPEPEVFYEQKQFAARIDASAVAIDRERLAVSIDYGAVPYSVCVDRLADIAIRASRFQANGEICLRPRFLAIKPGRWVEWQSARHGTRKFLVVSKRLGSMTSDTPRAVYLTLQEVGAGVFDPTAYETLPPPTTLPGTPIYASEPTNFLAVPISFETDGGQIVPALQFTWNAYDDITVIATEVEYRKVGSEDSVVKRADAPLQVMRTADGVLSDVDMEFRRRIVTSPPRTVAWTDWDMVHTTTASVASVSVGLANLNQDIRDLIASITAGTEVVMDALQQHALAATEDATTLASEQSLAVRFRNATASALQRVTVAIGEDEDGNLTAVAEILEALQAAVGEASAGILWRMNAEAGTGDVVARVVLQLRATVNDDFVTVGTIWETGFVGGDPGQPFGRIVQFADQFIITDGTLENLPFLFDDGVLYLNGVKAEWADIVNVNIVSAQIGDLQVQTSNLDFGAVTDFDDLTGSISSNYNTTGTNDYPVASATIDNPGGFPVTLNVDIEFSILSDNDNNFSATITLQLKRGSTVLIEWPYNFTGGIYIRQYDGASGVDVGEHFQFAYIDMFPPMGESTYTMSVKAVIPSTPGAAGYDVNIDCATGLMWNKR